MLIFMAVHFLPSVIQMCGMAKFEVIKFMIKQQKIVKRLLYAESDEYPLQHSNVRISSDLAVTCTSTSRKKANRIRADEETSLF